MDNVILIIESSETQSQLIEGAVKLLGLATYTAKSLAQLNQLITTHQEKKILAISNLVLPDAPNGEAVDLCQAHNIATIVLTSNFNQSIKQFILSKTNVVDYVIKSSKAINQTERILMQLIKHQGQGALICANEDEDTLELTRLLTLLQFKVFHADNAEEACELIASNPNIQIMLCDSQLGDDAKGGLALAQSVRSEHDKQSLCILGLSESNNEAIKAQFISSGASDSLTKPFVQQAVNQTILHS